MSPLRGTAAPGWGIGDSARRRGPLRCSTFSPVCLGSRTEARLDSARFPTAHGPSVRAPCRLGPPDQPGPSVLTMLCSDSPVTAETETPNRLFQCVLPFPGLACPATPFPPLPRLLWVGPCNLGALDHSGRPGIPGHVCAGAGAGESEWAEGVWRRGLTLKSGARGRRSFSAY